MRVQARLLKLGNKINLPTNPTEAVYDRACLRSRQPDRTLFSTLFNIRGFSEDCKVREVIITSFMTVKFGGYIVICFETVKLGR